MLGVIGGTGLYGVSEILTNVETLPIQETPFGKTSSPIMVGELRDDLSKKIAFIARHGLQHTYLPTEVPYAANIYALKLLGVRTLVSFSAVGSLKEEHRPGHFVMPLQFIDRTKGTRRSTFFGDGCVAHVSFADPVCPQLAEDIAAIADKFLPAGTVTLKLGGTYVCMEGPAFSTRAESNLYRSWGADMVGMTNVTEAKLAREAEIAYATVGMITDYDCWRVGEAAVSADAVSAVMKHNGEHALALLKAVAQHLDAAKDYPAHHALRGAIMGRRETMPPETYERLQPLIKEYVH